MASAKFLEEALSTDVDESAVNAIVGSLENQLVTSTPAVSNQQSSPSTVTLNHSNSAIANGGNLSTLKHGVTNGGSGSINNNIILNADANKTIIASTFPGSGVTHSNIVHTVAAPLQGAGPASGYVNQTATTNTASQPNYTQLTKAQEAVKLVYPAGSQQLNSSGVTNFNNSRVATFQPSSLPNGNLGLVPISSQNVLNAVTTSSTGIVNHNKQLGNLVAVDPSKQTLVIKTSGNQPLVSIPMTINTTMTHVNTTATGGMQSVVTLAKPISHAGSPGMLPANVQIVNVNAVRPQGANIVPKTVSPRVVIGSPGMVGARPGTPGQITLQTLQGLQAGTQGHLLLKTENGQYQLLRVGPSPTTQPGLVQNNAAGGTNSFRLQTIPAHSAVTVATTTAVQTVIQSQPPALTTQNTTAVQRHTVDTTKEKCRKFLANLLELSSREPKTVERNVRTLIQELIDTKVEPEEFCDRLERLLNASPQPCLIGFLKKSLPLLRQSLVTKELVIDGIRPPPHTVVYSQANAATVVQGIQPQLRPQITNATQVRVMSPAQALAPRLGQALQQRMVSPIRTPTATGRVMTTTLRPQNVGTAATNATASHVRLAGAALPAPPLHVRQPMKTLPAAAQAKINAVLHAKAAAAAKAASINKPPAPALMPKPAAKEKEKKSFHSAGYTGDDDINDVAAMGGVNLAEETQRILGSTEFVGRQIRSCKDEIFLHSTPLQQKIREIAARHGLEEPPPEVTALVSHAAQERLKNIVEKLGITAEHRIDFNKADGRYEITQDIKGQLKFLEELDRVEMKRHEEQERELLLRAAKSRSKSDDPEQAKLKAKAKEIQRAEMEEVRQREANLTALQAIGSRSKRPRVESGPGTTSAGQAAAGSSSGTGGTSRTPFPSRPRVKRVSLRDLLFLLEQEKDSRRSTLLYKSFLK